MPVEPQRPATHRLGEGRALGEFLYAPPIEHLQGTSQRSVLGRARQALARVGERAKMDLSRVDSAPLHLDGDVAQPGDRDPFVLRGSERKLPRDTVHSQRTFT